MTAVHNLRVRNLCAFKAGAAWLVNKIKRQRVLDDDRSQNDVAYIFYRDREVDEVADAGGIARGGFLREESSALRKGIDPGGPDDVAGESDRPGRTGESYGRDINNVGRAN